MKTFAILLTLSVSTLACFPIDRPNIKGYYPYDYRHGDIEDAYGCSYSSLKLFQIDEACPSEINWMRFHPYEGWDDPENIHDFMAFRMLHRHP